MAENIVGLKRTCMCAQLTEQDIGKTVTLMGWCHRQRDLGGLVFLLLRDRSGEIQLVADEATPADAREKAIRSRSEFDNTGVESASVPPSPQQYGTSSGLPPTTERSVVSYPKCFNGE